MFLNLWENYFKVSEVMALGSLMINLFKEEEATQATKEEDIQEIKEDTQEIKEEDIQVETKAMETKAMETKVMGIKVMGIKAMGIKVMGIKEGIDADWK